MGTYDSSIVLPISGQPISVGSYGKPVRDAILDLDARMLLQEAADVLPDSVSNTNSGASGTFSTAAGTWAVLPSNPLAVNFTNPSTVFNLVCNVSYGAWIRSATAGTQARFGLALSGGLTVATPGPGANQPVGWGLFPTNGGNASLSQHMGFFQMIIPPSVAAVTLTAMGYRSLANTVEFLYPTIHVVPDRYELP
ncbi:MAG: hypothetical protein ABW022_12590 [Actinoplanes sp.]